VVSWGCALLLDPDDYVDPPAPSSSTSAGAAGTGGQGGDSGNPAAGPGGAGGAGAAACSELPMMAAWDVELGGEFGEPEGALDVAAGSNAIYAVGRCQGKAHVVGTPFVVDCVAADVRNFVMKLADNGSPVWSKPIRSEAMEDRIAVAIAPDGSVWVAGGFGGMGAFSVADCASATSGGSSDVFVAHLDPNGLCLGSTTFMGGLRDYATDIVALPEGGAVVTGRYHGTMYVAGEPMQTDINNGDTFVVALDADAAMVWGRAMNGGGVDEADVRLALAGDDVFLAGTFEGGFNGQPPPGKVRNVFVARLGAEGGDLEAFNLFGGAQEDRLLDVAITSVGPALLVSFEPGTLQVGDATLSSDAMNVALIGLTPELEPTFAVDLEGLVTEGSLVADPGSDDLLFAVTSTMGVAGMASSGNDRDVYLGRAGCLGQVRWLHRLGDGDAQYGRGVAMLAGSLLVAGEFGGDIAFGLHNVSAGTGADGFVARYDIPE